jgi:hypothetical protein
VTVYEQLKAMEALLRDLLAEQDKEVLRTRLREGPFPERQDGSPRSPDFPLEEFTIGAAHTVAILAGQFYDSVRAQFPVPPGSRVVVGQRIISTWHGPAQPLDGSGGS